MTANRLILVFATLLVAFMLWPIKSGELWIIDDHEMVNQAYQYDSLKPASIFSRYKTLLLQTEVGKPDTASRYRPVYYAVRTLKSALMGDNAKVWFLSNVVYCLVGMATLGLALGRFFPWYVTLPFMALIMALPLHRDLWCRLGPAEIDAFTYCMVFCLAASRLQEKAFWMWPCCNIAVALAIGCKENFLMLFIPLGMLAIHGVMQKKFQLRQLWWFAVPALVAYPVVRVVMRTVESGRNIYNQDSSIQSLLNKTALFFTSPGFVICTACLAVLLLLYTTSRSAFLRKFLPVSLKSRDIHYSLAVFFIFAALVVGNFLFYSGTPHPGSRYAFPFCFLLPAMVLCPLYPLMPNIASGYTSSSKLKSVVAISGIVAISACVFLIHNNMLRIKQHIQLTINFQNAISEATGYREIFLINPGQMIASYEPYFSLKRYETAGYLPTVSYFPLFVEQISEFYKELENGLRSAISGQPPLTIAPDVLLWEPYGVGVRVIEHTRDNRDINELLTASNLTYTKDGLAYIASPVAFYVPMDDSAITSIAFVGSGENNLAEWQIHVNNHIITEENISYGENSFTIKLPKMESEGFMHPQLYKLSFEPNTTGTPTLYLRTLNLLR